MNAQEVFERYVDGDIDMEKGVTTRDLVQERSKLALVKLKLGAGLFQSARIALEVQRELGTYDADASNALLAVSRAPHVQLFHVAYLLGRGADPTHADSGTSTALHLLAECGAYLCVRYIALCGADCNVADFYGQTALIKACNTNLRSKQRLRTVEALLRVRGLRVDHVDCYGKSALSYAAEASDVWLVKRLLTAFASVWNPLSTPVPMSKLGPPASDKLRALHLEEIVDERGGEEEKGEKDGEEKEEDDEPLTESYRGRRRGRGKEEGEGESKSDWPSPSKRAPAPPAPPGQSGKSGKSGKSAPEAEAVLENHILPYLDFTSLPRRETTSPFNVTDVWVRGQLATHNRFELCIRMLLCKLRLEVKFSQRYKDMMAKATSDVLREERRTAKMEGVGGVGGTTEEERMMSAQERQQARQGRRDGKARVKAAQESNKVEMEREQRRAGWMAAIDQKYKVDLRGMFA
ncbi:ankyrin repeat-containing domain protein [Ochromonadaceae sp. CCMP2298]|nr:ankyrin repeat-containing domain protein [Ochromonadaceae sp. CCMP2298]